MNTHTRSSPSPAATAVDPPLRIVIDDVFTFTAVTTGTVGMRRPVAFLFPVRHVLELPAGTYSSQVLDASTGLTRILLERTAATIRVSVPDFDVWRPTVAYKDQKKRFDVLVQMSGEALVARRAPGPAGEYEVRVGSLHCDASPVFGAIKHAKPVVPGSLLAHLWPTVSPDGVGLAYVWTAEGLCLRGTVCSRDEPDLLRLPKRRGDLAWLAVESDPDLYMHFAAWDWSSEPMQSEAALSAGIASEIEPLPWAPGKMPWTVLRWHVLSSSRPVVERAFTRVFDGALNVRLQRVDGGPAPGDGTHVDTLVVRIEAPYTDKKMELAHRGGLLLSAGPVLAHLQWPVRRRSSVLRADLAIAHWQRHSALGLQWDGWTLRSRQFGKKRPNSATAGLEIDWQINGTAAPVLTLAPCEMFYAGLADANGNHLTGPDIRPDWLTTSDGMLQLSPEALSAAPPAGLKDAVNAPSEEFMGGVPLDALGGPQGLTAWMSQNVQRLEGAAAVLRLRGGRAQLVLRDPLLTWRTPAWWVATRAPRAGLGPAQESRAMVEPPSGAPDMASLQARFRDAFRAGYGKPPSASEATDRLVATLADVFVSTHWIGRIGSAEPDAWGLAVKAAEAEFSIPGGLRSRIKAWSRFENAHFVRTIPMSNESNTGPLLDPFRSLFPARPKPSTKPVVFQLKSGQLPMFRQRPFQAPGKAGADWWSLGEVGFHPHITGLSLEGGDDSLASLVLRHGNQMHLERLMRVTADGDSRQTDALVPLPKLRPVDDLAVSDVRAGSTYQVAGWLPQPTTVETTVVALELGGAHPHLTFKVAGVADTLRVGADVRADGVGAMVGVVPPQGGHPPRLVPVATTGSQTLLNFGQPLLQVSALETLDGAGCIQRIFDGEARTESAWDGAGATARVLTFRRVAKIGWSGLPATELALSVLDRRGVAREAVAWDLSGEGHDDGSSPPVIGPCAVVPRDILWDDERVLVSCKLAVPWTRPFGAQVDDVPPQTLSWPLSDDGHGPTLSGATLHWRFDSDLARRGMCVRALHVQVSGDLQALRAEVVRVEFETVTLGRIWVVPDRAAALTWQQTEEGHAIFQCRLECTLRGLDVDATLTGRQGLGGCEIGIQLHRVLRWGPLKGMHIALSEDGRLRLEGLQIGNHRPSLDLQKPAWADEGQWLVCATDGHTTLAGSLITKAPHNGSTQVALRCQLKSSKVDPRQLAKGCDASLSWLILTADLQWACTDAAAPPVRKAQAGGLFVFVNDFRFRRDDGVLLLDEIAGLVDGAPCRIEQDGSLTWVDRPALLATHTLRVEAEPAPLLEFAAVHRFDINAGELSCAQLVFLAASGMKPPACEPQVLFGVDRALGVAPTQLPPDGTLQGAVLRLPVRCGGATCELKMPPSRGRALGWFPLAPPPRFVAAVAEDRWHDRRALADFLSSTTLDALAENQTIAHFAGKRPLPLPGEVLEEYADLALLSGWCISGALSGGGGVFALPWRGGAVTQSVVQTLEQASAASVRVDLLVAASSSDVGMRILARGLVARASDGAIATWARTELKRRRHQGPALAIGLGRDDCTALLPHALGATAVPPTSADPVGTPLRAPSHGFPLSFLIDAELPATDVDVRRQVALVARLDDGAVVELVHALPRVQGMESATEYRLVLNSAMTDTSRGLSSRFGLAHRQSIQFESDSAPGDDSPRTMPSLHRPDMADVVTPPLVDVTLWSYRPGDSIWTEWMGSGSASSAGPTARARLRAPRPDQHAPLGGGAPDGERFDVEHAASASVGNVGWRLRQVTKVRSIGRPYAGTYSTLLTLAVPRGVQHRVEPDVEGHTVADANLREVQRLASLPLTRTQEHDDQYLLSDPLVAGAFAMKADVNDEWGLAVVDGELNEVAHLPDVGEVLATDEWKTPARASAVSIHRFGTRSELVARRLEDPQSYHAAPGERLALLMSRTPRLVGNPARPALHWLHGKPWLALWVRPSGSGRVSLVRQMEITWIDASSVDPPALVCAVSGSSGSGFGPVNGGPSGIAMEHQAQFDHWQRVYVLEWPSQQAQTMAWQFEPSGACSASAKL